MDGLDLGIDGLTQYRELGSGGFATVYAANEVAQGRQVAVKVLRAVDDAARRRFDRERRTMGLTTGHPNIVTLFRSGYTANGNRPFLVMEYLPGGSLQDRIDRTGPMDWPAAIGLILPIADALGFSHGHGIVHRDVKPANILLSASGVPKLTDFGISAIAEGTVTNQVAYSLSYTPPETFGALPDAASGEVADPRDGRSDLYSLGATLYALGTGAPPFHHPSPAGQINQILVQPPPTTGQPGIDWFLATAMAKAPADRHPTAASFVAELEAAGGWLTPSSTSSPTTPAPRAPYAPTNTAPGSAPPLSPAAPSDSGPPFSPVAPPGSGPPFSPAAPSDSGPPFSPAAPPGSGPPFSPPAPPGSAPPHSSPGPPGSGQAGRSSPPSGVGAPAGGALPLAPAAPPAPDRRLSFLSGTSGLFLATFVGIVVVTIGAVLALRTWDGLGGTDDVAGDSAENAGEPDDAPSSGSGTTTPDNSDDDPGDDGGGGDDEPAPTAGGEVGGDGVLTVGGLLPETGNLAFLGPPMQAGVELAIADINAGGGVFGRDVTWLPGDSGDNGDVANATVDRLLEENVDAFIGAASSGVSLTVIDRITGAGLIQVSPSNTSTAFTNYADDGRYFRTAPSDAIQGVALAETVLGDGAVTAAFLALDDSYGVDLLDIATERFEANGGEVVFEQVYDPNAASFDGLVESAVAPDPDAIVIIGFFETAQILQALIDRGAGPGDKLIYGTDGNMGTYLASEFADPSVLAGMRGTLPGVDVPGTQPDFADRLDALDPSLVDYSYSAESYDAVVLVALGAIAAGVDDPEAIAAEINDITRGGETCTTFTSCAGLLNDGVDIDYDGLSGPLEFSDVGDPVRASILVLEFDGAGTLFVAESVLADGG